MVKRLFILLFICLAIFSFIDIISAANPVHLIRNNTWSSNLSGVFYGSLSLGDIDNDGDYDLIGMGCISGGFTNCATADKIRVYINNGTTFNENLTWEQNTTNLGYGSLSLGDINNDGKLDLIALGDKGGGNGDVQIYINNGTTFLENLTWENNLSVVNAFNGAIAVGDINNDGKLDLVLVGAYPINNNGVYINNGTSFVKDSNWLDSLPLVGFGLGGGALILGDYNNDGKLDLAFAGSYSTNFYANIYINNGTSLVDNFSFANDFNAIFGFPSLAIGDYDNNGFIDLAAMGARAGDHQKIYNNTGTNFTFHPSDTLSGYLEGSMAFGDIDNDGDLDLGAMGRESGRDRIFTNNNTVFDVDIFEQQDMHTDNMEWGGLAWVDVNGDKNLDLVINGYNPNDGSKNFTVYISNASITKNNTLPTSPNMFTSNYSITNNQLNLTWNNGSDADTPSTGLYYNLMVGNSTTNNTIVSGVYGGSSNPTAGYFGNMMQRKNITLNLVLAEGTYYWYVQTIDTGLAKSNWSEGQSFTVGSDTTKPVISNVASSSITTSTATITWSTDEMANSTVYYGTTTSTTSYSSSVGLTMSHSIGLSGLSASTTYYYNVSSCDDSSNCNTSQQSTFTTSASPGGGDGGGGGGGGGGTITTKPTIPTPKEFDIDFSTATSGILDAKQGDIKTFSFNSEIKHSITLLAVTTNSITLLITSEPITIQINIGEIKQIDINKEGINDLEIKLISIISGKAKFSITKLAGADIVSQEEIEKETRKEALFDVKVSLSNLFNIVKTGREVIAKIEVLNVNNIGQVDVAVDYYITTKEDNKTKLAEGSDTLAVEAVASFARSLRVPYELKAGKYLFNVDVKYQGNILASGSVEFIVVKTYEIFIAVGIAVLIVAGIFFYLWRIKRKEEKLEKKERKDVAILKRKENRLEREIKMLKNKRKRRKWQ